MSGIVFSIPVKTEDDREGKVYQFYLPDEDIDKIIKSFENLGYNGTHMHYVDSKGKTNKGLLPPKRNIFKVWMTNNEWFDLYDGILVDSFYNKIRETLLAGLRTTRQ